MAKCGVSINNVSTTHQKVKELAENFQMTTMEKIGSSRSCRVTIKRYNCLAILVICAILALIFFFRLNRFVYSPQLIFSETTSSTSTGNFQSRSFTTLPTNIIPYKVPPITSLASMITSLIPLSSLISSTSEISASTTTTTTPPISSTSTTIPRSSTPTIGTTTTTTTPVASHPTNVSRYVSFSGGFADGRGLGNQLFCFAAVIYVAELTGREPAIEKFRYVIALDVVFDLNVERFDSICPCHWIHEEKHLAFDESTDAEALNIQEAANKSILVSGFRQSWRYTMAIEHRLRRHLTFKEEIRNFSEHFLRTHIPPGWNRAGFVRIAIHVRRGDILSKRLSDYGYTFPNISYFTKAMSYFADRYRRVQFLTFSDDPDWTKEFIKEDLVTPRKNSTIKVTHVSGHNAGQDLAIMSMCDHVIISTGTYGWWAAWLAKGTTVYYGNWPRNGSELEKHFKKYDFFPPYWIPMTD